MRQNICTDGIPETATRQTDRVKQWLEDNDVRWRLVPVHSQVYVEDGILHFEQYVTVDARGQVIKTEFAKPVSFPWDGE